MRGKIIKGIAGFYYVDDGQGLVVQCRAKGVFRNRKIKPLVGDNVEFDLTDEKDLEGNVTEILPRKNALIRPAAANVDQALVVFAGPSGVGKSSLTNKLFPEAAMATGSISEKIQRGRHTTRHTELFSLGNHTYMMDTPGFSSMYIENMEASELKNYFPEFARWEDQCRFLGCVHIGERDCGVKDAVQRGEIPESRYENYRLMYQELKDKRRY